MSERPVLTYHQGCGPPLDPTCPYCGRVLVVARKYNVWNEARPICLDDAHSAPVLLWADIWVLVLLWRAYGALSGRMSLYTKARRVRRIVADFPGSLICPNCGLVQKRLGDEV